MKKRRILLLIIVGRGGHLHLPFVDRSFPDDLDDSDTSYLMTERERIGALLDGYDPQPTSILHPDRQGDQAELLKFAEELEVELTFLDLTSDDLSAYANMVDKEAVTV